MKFKTETGSIYEVDTQNSRARRVSGVTAATKRFNDGWRNYVNVSPIEVGGYVVFIWDTKDTPPIVDLGGMPSVPITTTSRVTEILKEEEPS